METDLMANVAERDIDLTLLAYCGIHFIQFEMQGLFNMYLKWAQLNV